MLWLGFGHQNLFYGETLACCPRAVYPPGFFWTVARRCSSVFLWLWLGHINMENKRFGHAYHNISPRWNRRGSLHL
jgi:hypothetical protein